MIGRLSLLIGALVAGMAVASFIPGLSERLRTTVGFSSGPGASPQLPPKSDAVATDNHQGVIKLTEEEIEAASIEIATVRNGTIANRIVVPGTIIPHADHIARVAVKLSGTVAELRKKIGDPTAKDEV